MKLSDYLEITGLALFAAFAVLIWWPAAIAVAGAGCFIISIGLGRRGK